MAEKRLPHDHGHLSDRLQERMPEAEAFEAASAALKVVSDSKRAQIFWILCHGEECVINIAALADMSSPAASHHLRLLKTAGLITSRREGKEVYYTAAETRQARALHATIEQILEVTCPDEDAERQKRADSAGHKSRQKRQTE